MENLKIGNRTFALLPNCTFGDYGGDSSVGLANIRYLREQFADRMLVDSFDDWNNDGTLIEVDTIESEDQPDPYPSIPECSDSTEYVRKFCELNHLKG